MTKRKILSGVLAILLAASSVLSLASCGKPAEAKKEKRTNVYAGTEITLPAELDYINSLAASGETAYVRFSTSYSVTYNDQNEEVEREPGYDYQEVSKKEEKLPKGWYIEFDSQRMIAVVDLASGAMKTAPISYDTEQYGDIGNLFAPSPDGKLLTLSDITHYDDSGDSTEVYLLKLDPATGDLTEHILLNDELVKAGFDLQDFYGNSYAFVGDSIYIASGATLAVFGIDGSYRTKIDLEINSTDIWIRDLLVCGDRMVVDYMTGSSDKMKVVQNGTVSNLESDALADAAIMTIMPGDAENLYFRSMSGIYAYNFAKDTFGEVLNFINSDLDSTALDRAIFLEDGRLVMASTDYSNGKTSATLSVLKRVPDEELEEEVILRLGCVYMDYNLRRAVLRYNKRNTGIRVSIVDYSVYNNEENMYQGANAQLNNDITTGKLPDIVQITNQMPIQNYFRKNIFVDLNKFIDDPEIGIDRSKLMENVINANLTNGKLPSMIVAYSINTLQAKSELVGTEPGWTFEEMMAAINALPEGAKAFYDYSRDAIISNFFQYAMDSFIDWDNQTTHFDSPGFIEFVKYLGTCSEKSYWEELYGGGQYEYDPARETAMEEEYQLRYVRDAAMFNMMYLYTYTDYLSSIKQFMADVTAIGYPTTGDDNGAVIVPSSEFAISVKSTAQKEAWDFIKFMMSPESAAQNRAFSVSREHMDKLYAESKDNFTTYFSYTEDDREAWKSRGFSDEYIEFMMNSAPKYDQEQIDYIRDIVNNASRIARTDTDLVDIVKEELSAYFAGQKSAEDVSKQIASRAGIYVSEHS